ncbi:hypothetical protein [Niallia sp. Krafla_26]|uniref:hypothetical protein n=1 Tax=Niallia sp. Krafla_26 TaxID=3064703 RepID=UPI003D16C924
MTKRELFQLLKLISVYYDSFELQQEKVDEWYHILQGESFQKVEETLKKHVAHSPYPPRVSELICKPENGARAIPNREDTRFIIQLNGCPASEEVVEQSLAKIREILGIQRGER